MDALLIQQYISQKRFGKYVSLDDYEKNLHLSKHYYIPLSVLEVSLRNAINHAFDKLYGAGWLIHEAHFLQRDQLKKISDAKAKIKSRNEYLTKDKLVAELSFGFWVNLFKSSYNNQMRINTLRQIFSNLPPKKEQLVSRKEIFQALNHIRNFRNRIFHHERVFGKPEFQNIEQDINQILCYLHKDILAFSKRVNHVR